jgi:hypothetical protein
LYTVAHAWVLFERLIYKKLVRDDNDAIYLTICLLISIKIVEEHVGTDAKQRKQERLDEDTKKLLGQ